uniref:Uncharacterized protein n=1 Tax=Timema cristinae TaxID=61476 RepID=A0A7R9DPS8_TIMCR|nr:unnamed protein product [Timema cristinae]
MAARRKMAAVLTKTFVVGCRNKSSAVSASVISELEAGQLTEWDKARPYSELPGPRPLPLLGNSWRFIPYIGKYKHQTSSSSGEQLEADECPPSRVVTGDYRIQEVDKVCRRLHAQYGRVVKLSSLLGRPDMVFLFDPDDIERVFRSEELMPHRPSMPSLNYYKHVLRRDFFGDNPGLIAVHGESWCKFRTKVQQPMLQPRTAKLYVRQVEQTAKHFVQR